MSHCTPGRHPAWLPVGRRHAGRPFSHHRPARGTHQFLRSGSATCVL